MKHSTFLFFILLLLPILYGCDEDEPPEENEEEIINAVRLEFLQSGAAVTEAEWLDPDGEGSGAPIIDTVRLTAGEEFEMHVFFENTIEPSQEEDINEEIEENAHDHQIYFEFTEGLFSDPEGDGNVDAEDDPVNYLDFDGNTLPIGLETEWTTGLSGEKGNLRIILKLQPGIKSETSTASQGVSEIDVTFPVVIE